MHIAGFEWDAGNWPKCGKHGVSKAQIEAVFRNTPSVMSDPNPSEQRLRAVGRTDQGRYVFLVFTLRPRSAQTWIRPISARFMHQTEIKHYEHKT